MDKKVPALEVVTYLVDVAEKRTALHRGGYAEGRDALAALTELFAALAPVVQSLVARIDQDNAMSPQAVMTRRLANAFKLVTA